MYFLDLATHGVRGFAPSTRVALYPGYVVLQPRGSEPVPLSGLALALLYADGSGADASLAVEGAKGPKAALMLQGNDSVTYRIVRELGGVGALQRLNKESHRFELVTQDLLEADQFLRSQVGVPIRAAFERLFILNAAQLPSRNSKEKAGGRKASPASASSADVPAERRLRELSKELELAEEVEQLQAKQDEIVSELTRLEPVLNGTEGISAALEEAERAWQSAPTPESLGVPPDILERLERYPELGQKRDAALAKLDADREAAAAAAEEEESTPTSVAPLYSDPRFLIAAALGTACLVGGAFLQGSARYVALLDVPFFGAAALFALQWVDGARGGLRSGRHAGRFASREKRIQNEFEAEAEPVRRALRKLGVETADEARNVLAQKEVLSQRVEELRQQLTQSQSDQEAASAAQKYAELKARSEAIAAKLQDLAGGYVRGSQEVQREMQRVRESTGSGTSAGPVAAPWLNGAIDDPSPMLLTIAADVVQSDISSIVEQVKARCGHYLAALSERRYPAVEFDETGRATLVAGDKRTPASELPSQDLNLLFLALRMAVVEKVSAVSRVPFLIEDLEGAVESSKQVLLARMLKQLGTATQVLHLTSSPVFAAAADSTAAV